jgi:hypothetical protein
MAAALAIYGTHLYRHTCFAVGGLDSSGYANTARALSRGQLVEPLDALGRFRLPDSIAAAFTPFGFVHGPRDGTLAPFYPVGLPLHLAAAGALFGWRTAPYLVSPLFAILSLVLVYLVGRRMGLAGWAAAGAAAILAACPVFVFQAIQPMSDVVATFWVLAALLCALKSRDDWRWALVAGVCIGAGVLVRPSNVLLAVPLVFALRWNSRAIAAFLAGGITFAAILLGYDSLCYGSPFETGYGMTGHWGALAWANARTRVVDYAMWTSQILTPVVCLGWLGALFDRKIAARDRVLLGSWFAVLFVFYIFYAPADVWWYTRFLLPGLPALPLGFFVLVRDLSRATRWPRVVEAAAAIGVVLIVRAGFRSTRELGVLEMPRMQAVFPQACALASSRLPAGALVLSRDMSGALRYYTNLTPVRWDALDPATFQSLRTATEADGGRWFALLMKGEIEFAAPRLPGNWTFLGEAGSVSLWRLER